MAALKGIRILDLTLTLPGPYCTHLLADFGAEVIKVENPEAGGDWFRTEKPSIEGWGIRFLDLNRNKKSITLNLKSPQGKEIFSALARTSQVIVEGFRPGVVERLGIDYRRMKEINSRIVYCSISGYGQDGPYRLLAGHDLNYMGYSGILDPQGYADRPAALPSVFIADYSGGGADGRSGNSGGPHGCPERRKRAMGGYFHARRSGGIAACRPGGASLYRKVS